MCEFLVTFSDCFLVFVIFWRVVLYLKTNLICELDWRIKLYKTTNILSLANLCGIHYELICAILHTHACNSGLNWHTVMWRKFCNQFVWFLKVFIFPESGLHFSLMHWHLCIQIVFFYPDALGYTPLCNWTQQIWSPCLIYFEFAWRFIPSWAPICNTRNFVI